MPPREDDAVAPRAAAPGARTLIQAGGFALAGLATLAVFLTDDPRYLRVAVVGVAWAFLLATFAAGRRDTDRVAAAARERELRQAYELELDREIAARREFELELEHQLRRELEDAMRAELDALRGDIAVLSGLRDDVPRVSDLRGDLAALTGLRDEVARVAALRDDVAALLSLRQDLGELSELRADVSRLRAELTEQLSGEMLVERIVMRTQAGRLPGEPARLDDGPGRVVEGAGWADDTPPRELTGGWPAIRLDEPRGTRQFDQVHAERPAARMPAPEPAGPRRPGRGTRAADLRFREAPRTGAQDAPRPAAHDAPATTAWSAAPAPSRESPGTAAWSAAPAPPTWEAPAAGAWPATSAQPARPSWDSPGNTAGSAAPPPAGAVDEPRSPYAVDGSRRRHAHEDPADPPRTTMSPLAPASIARPPLPQHSTSSPLAQLPADRSPVPHPAPGKASHRGSDEVRRPPDDRPPVPQPVPVDDRGGYRTPGRDEGPAPTPGPRQDKRLADILAENEVHPSSGGRRRRRYRDEGEPDDVLARVLGRGER